MQVACYKVVKTLTEQVETEPLHEGKLAGWVNMLVDRMTIQDTQVGCESEEFKPAAGHVEADGLFDKLDEHCQSVVDLFDPNIVLEAMGRSNGTEGPGVDAGPFMGSAGDDGGGPFSRQYYIIWPGRVRIHADKAR